MVNSDHGHFGRGLFGSRRGSKRSLAGFMDSPISGAFEFDPKADTYSIDPADHYADLWSVHFCYQHLANFIDLYYYTRVQRRRFSAGPIVQYCSFGNQLYFELCG